MRSARNEAREEARNGKILTGRGPAWLTAKGTNGNRVWEVNALAKKTIRQIFRWKRDGLSYKQMERKLNAAPDEYWPRPKGWRTSYITKLLTNEAVIGIYQPHTVANETGNREPVGEAIEKYYPAIVDRAAFFAVRKKMRANKGKGGRNGAATNLLRHLMKCAYCGSPMALVDKGKPPKGGKYFTCDKARRGLGCDGTYIRYDECERVVLKSCRKLDPASILPDASEQEKECKQLRDAIAGAAVEQAQIEEQINNLVDHVAATASTTVRIRYEKKMGELQARHDELRTETEAMRQKLSEMERSAQSVKNWLKTLATLEKAIATDVECRLRTQEHLQELIERIDVYFVGFPDDGRLPLADRAAKTTDNRLRYVPRGSHCASDLAETFDALVEDVSLSRKLKREWAPFLKWVTEQQKTKAGRFLSIRFRSGASLVVPTTESTPQDAWDEFLRAKKR